MGRRFTKKQLDFFKSKITSEDEFKLLLEADDPVLWAETYLFDPDKGEVPFKCKKQFVGPISSPRLNRAARVGRQQGKTVHMCIDILHSAGTNSRETILVFIPEKKQMNRMLEIMNNVLHGSELQSSYRMGTSKTVKDSLEPQYDYEIKSSTGSVIRFFFMNQKPDKARGQAATRIYIDEAEYIPEKAWPVINGIIKGNPNIPMWASSTPSGLEDTWFRNFCDRCSDPKNKDGVEFHLPSTLEENWEEVEARLKDLIFDEVTWKLEVLAEWAEAVGAVYKKEVIDASIERSSISGVFPSLEELRSMIEYEKAHKFIGIDWNNPQNGVRIVEASTMFGSLWITRHETISYEEYTQTNSVDRILQLHKENRYKLISVDAGYGETQIELLQKGIVALGEEPKDILNIVDSAKKEKVDLYYENSEGGRRRETISVRVKTKIIGLVGKYLESTLIIPREEDSYREGLAKELRNFRRKGSLREGGFVYTDKTHSLSALQFCLHGYDKIVRELSVPKGSTHIESGSLMDVLKTVSSGKAEEHTIAVSSAGIFTQRASTNRRTLGLTRGRSRRTIL